MSSRRRAGLALRQSPNSSVIVTPSSLAGGPNFACAPSAAGSRFNWRNASAIAIVAATPTFSERSGGRMGMRSFASAAASTSAGTPADSRPTRMTSPSAECEIPHIRLALGRQEHETALRSLAPSLELFPRVVNRDRDGVPIVHHGPPKPAVSDPEAGGLDHGGVDAETGAGAKHRPGVLGDVGLVQRKKKRGGRLDHIGAH